MREMTIAGGGFPRCTHFARIGNDKRAYRKLADYPPRGHPGAHALRLPHGRRVWTACYVCGQPASFQSVTRCPRRYIECGGPCKGGL